MFGQGDVIDGATARHRVKSLLSRTLSSRKGGEGMTSRSWLVVVFSFTVAASAASAVITEDFASDPLGRGWISQGDGSLFRWNSTNQNLEVTWDSSRTNSFFYVPLRTILAKSDDFSFSFDIRLKDIRTGVSLTKTDTFE